eukprot:Nk52_evm1s2443 gene=Nk52_evmTU1s2443
MRGVSDNKSLPSQRRLFVACLCVFVCVLGVVHLSHASPTPGMFDPAKARLLKLVPRGSWISGGSKESCVEAKPIDVVRGVPPEALPEVPQSTYKVGDKCVEYKTA